MLTKLTLTIEKGIVEKAKKYAKKKRKSVSKIVGEYLRTISDKQDKFFFQNKLSVPITESISGMFKDSGKDYKKILEESLMEKHL